MKRRGYVLGELLIVIAIIFLPLGYFFNISRLIDCDFASPYRAEVIRTVGVFVPPVGCLAGYINLGK